MLILNHVWVLQALSLFPKLLRSLLFIRKIELICVVFGFVWNWILSNTFFATDNFIFDSFFLLNLNLRLFEFFREWIYLEDKGSRPIVNKRLNRFFFDWLIISNFILNAPEFHLRFKSAHITVQFLMTVGWWFNHFFNDNLFLRLRVFLFIFWPKNQMHVGLR